MQRRGEPYKPNTTQQPRSPAISQQPLPTPSTSTGMKASDLTSIATAVAMLGGTALALHYLKGWFATVLCITLMVVSFGVLLRILYGVFYGLSHGYSSRVNGALDENELEDDDDDNGKRKKPMSRNELAAVWESLKTK